MDTQPAAVWIIDCTNFLDYLESKFEKMSQQFPFLRESNPDYRWDWKTNVAQMNHSNSLSQKQELIDWLIRAQLERIYLFGVQGQYPIVENQIIHNVLISEHGLDGLTYHLLPIPKTYWYGELNLVTRTSGALVIEFYRIN